MFIDDHTRVKLIDVDHSVSGSEYINANYIRLPTDGEQQQQQQQLNCNAVGAAGSSTNAIINNIQMNSSQESLNNGGGGGGGAGGGGSGSCAACAAAQLQKNCTNCQLLNKTCVQCAMKTATLPYNNCSKCLKRAESLAKHKRNESLSNNISGQCNQMMATINGGSGIVGVNNSMSNLSSSGSGSGGNGFVKHSLNQQPGDLLYKTYIATQGCLTNTIIDFWNMIWQENTRVIVMTTKEFERDKNKCAKYWPDEGQTKQFGPAKIQCVMENSTLRDYTLREFLFSWRDQPERRIYHYHFQVWPDHGVPADPGCVLNFLQDVNTKQSQLTLAGEKPV